MPGLQHIDIKKGRAISDPASLIYVLGAASMVTHIVDAAPFRVSRLNLSGNSFYLSAMYLYVRILSLALVLLSEPNNRDLADEFRPWDDAPIVPIQEVVL